MTLYNRVGAGIKDRSGREKEKAELRLRMTVQVILLPDPVAFTRTHSTVELDRPEQCNSKNKKAQTSDACTK